MGGGRGLAPGRTAGAPHDVGRDGRRAMACRRRPAAGQEAASAHRQRAGGRLALHAGANCMGPVTCHGPAALQRPLGPWHLNARQRDSSDTAHTTAVPFFPILPLHGCPVLLCIKNRGGAVPMPAGHGWPVHCHLQRTEQCARKCEDLCCRQNRQAPFLPLRMMIRSPVGGSTPAGVVCWLCATAPWLSLFMVCVCRPPPPWRHVYMHVYMPSASSADPFLTGRVSVAMVLWDVGHAFWAGFWR